MWNLKVDISSYELEGLINPSASVFELFILFFNKDS